MTQDEVAMLTFALRWAPYGGGDEHILPEFGLLPAVFYRRLQAILMARALDGVEFATRRGLLELCAVKTSGSSSSASNAGRREVTQSA
jgi:hypothetical protein